MDQQEREQFREMRIIKLSQRIEIIAVVEETDPDDPDAIFQNKLVIESLERPLPLPYSEVQ